MARAAALPTWRTAHYTIIELPAQIDIATADGVREELLAELNSGDGPVIADFTRTDFCDSTAVNALLRAHTRPRALRRRLYAAIPPGGLVRKVFDITAATRQIPTCDDLGSAVARAVVATMDEAALRK